MKREIAIRWHFICLKGATIGARWSMSLMDKVILAKDYQTSTAVLESTLNRTICEDLEVRWGWRQGFKAKGLCAGMVAFSCQLV